MKTRQTTLAGLAVTLLLLAAGCGSVGDILGGGGSDNSVNNGTIRGVVDYVDLNNRSMTLTNVSGYSSMLSNSGSGNGSTVRVYFDAQTPVEYNGQSYRPEDLERGDEVQVAVNESGSQLVADRVTVLRDVTVNGSTSTGSGDYNQTIRGTVRSVNTSRGTVEIDRGYNSTTVVEYDTRTAVSYGGRTYGVLDLENGDEVEIRATDLGSGRWRAEQISVLRSVGGGTTGNSTYGDRAVIRGTVRSIDTYNRTLQLEQASWISGFNTNASTLTVQYGSNANVIYGNQSYPITNLERGDQIEVEVDRNGSTYMANRINLVRDVNSR
jgi:hypothetical protein